MNFLEMSRIEGNLKRLAESVEYIPLNCWRWNENTLDATKAPSPGQSSGSELHDSIQSEVLGYNRWTLASKKRVGTWDHSKGHQGAWANCQALSQSPRWTSLRQSRDGRLPVPNITRSFFSLSRLWRPRVPDNTIWKKYEKSNSWAIIFQPLRTSSCGSSGNSASSSSSESTVVPMERILPVVFFVLEKSALGNAKKKLASPNFPKLPFFGGHLSVLASPGKMEVMPWPSMRPQGENQLQCQLDVLRKDFTSSDPHHGIHCHRFLEQVLTLLLTHLCGKQQEEMITRMKSRKRMRGYLSSSPTCGWGPAGNTLLRDLRLRSSG